MTHTKGPWAIAGEEHANVILSEDFVIADVYAFKKGEAGPRTDEEGEANARLIAAAPDLLEALKANLTALDEIRDMFAAHDMPGLTDLIEQTTAAIAKAEGKGE